MTTTIDARAQHAIEVANEVAGDLWIGCCFSLDDNEDAMRWESAEFAEWFDPRKGKGYWWPFTEKGCTARVIALSLYSILIQEGQA